MNLIIDSQYFTPVILFKNLYKFSNITFEQYEHHQKMSFRSRCQVAGSEGLLNLSIPLAKGRDQRTLIKDVRMADNIPWQSQHWKTLLSCYSRSPWFEYYREDLGNLYTKPVAFLLDWNQACFEWSLRALKMSISVSLTESYRKHYEEEDWIDWRGKILPKYRDLSMGQGPVKYRQVFEERIGFLPNLSILDLLFCEGKRAAALLSADQETA
jgi:hypothetical protein